MYYSETNEKGKLLDLVRKVKAEVLYFWRIASSGQRLTKMDGVR